VEQDRIVPADTAVVAHSREVLTLSWEAGEPKAIARAIKFALIPVEDLLSRTAAAALAVLATVAVKDFIRHRVVEAAVVAPE
jgi:hypothetical protein